MRQMSSSALVNTRASISVGGLRDSCLPEWVMSIPGIRRIVDKLGVTEFRRRLFHMSPSLLPICLPFIPHPDVWGPILLTIILVMSLVCICVACLLGHLLKRRGEQTWSASVLGYMVPVVGALLLFPGRAEFGLMTLQILALGDGSATLGGLMLGGKRLPWNRRKTFSGLFCFTIVASIASTYSYWGEASPTVPVLAAFVICCTSTLCAAIAESLPVKTNDNWRVGLTALFVGILMSNLVA